MIPATRVGFTSIPVIIMQNDNSRTRFDCTSTARSQLLLEITLNYRELSLRATRFWSIAVR